MNPVFSVLHATYNRPEKAVATMKLFMQQAMHPECVEYIFAVNIDDPSAKRLKELVDEFANDGSAIIVHPLRVDIIIGEFHGSAPAWDMAAKASHGSFLIQGQDDVEPPVAWDVLLAQRFITDAAATFVAVSDGYRKDKLCCTAIMNRPYYEMEGHFLCPEYISVFSDDDVTYRALRNARDGKSAFVDARDIVFLHRHHYHDKSVPWDQTYEKENNAHAYVVGMKLFNERNPRAATDGLKSW